MNDKIMKASMYQIRKIKSRRNHLLIALVYKEETIIRNRKKKLKID